MTDLVPFEYSDDRSYDEQIRDALEKALAIQGTVINDLESALNCILQMERALRMVGAPNPHETSAQYLIQKYKMGKQTSDKSVNESRRLLEAGTGLVEGNDEPLELIEGEVVDNN